MVPGLACGLPDSAQQASSGATDRHDDHAQKRDFTAWQEVLAELGVALLQQRAFYRGLLVTFTPSKSPLGRIPD